MPEVTIQTTLTLNESSQADASDIQVQLSLDTGTETLWTRDKQPRQIDEISVEFEDKQTPKETGNITLCISLLNGAKFVKPYLSESKLATKEVSEIPCVSFKPKQKNTVLEVDFEQPPKGTKPLNYPEMFFHTSSGVVDPIIVIRRR